MNRLMLRAPIIFLIMLASLAMCGMEAGTYYGVSVWHGNVMPTTLSECSGGSVCLNFDYAGERHGYTKDQECIRAHGDRRLPWLWCDVSRSGSATCYVPQIKGAGGR